ncbi:MAG: hypothetical protein H7248_04440 [Microbacteriaceae bacterium]|nr:hypothetical protein [Microbacteriaceae bacterium]
MRTLTKTVGILLGTGLILAAAAAPATASTSSSSDVNVTVTGGTITATTYGATLAGVTLNGLDQTTTGTSTSAWTLTDARGTGAAWTLTATASDFTSAAGSTDSIARTITAPHLGIGLTTITALGTSDAAPVPSSVAAMSSSVQSTLVTAASNKGSFSVAAPTFTLGVPANAFRSNYKVGLSGDVNPYISTITFTIG